MLLGLQFIKHCLQFSDAALNDLYWSPNIVLLIKLRRMRCVGHVMCMGDRRDIQGFGEET
jgi:hypothetical protein